MGNEDLLGLAGWVTITADRGLLLDALKPFADGDVDVSGTAVILNCPDAAEAIRRARDAVDAATRTPAPSLGEDVVERGRKIITELEMAVEEGAGDLATGCIELIRDMIAALSSMRPVQEGQLPQSITSLANRCEGMDADETIEVRVGDLRDAAKETGRAFTRWMSAASRPVQEEGVDLGPDDWAAEQTRLPSKDAHPEASPPSLGVEELK